MLTDNDKLELFDNLLRDALTLAGPRAEFDGFGERRTAWKNVHAVRSLRDAPPRGEPQGAHTETADLPGSIVGDGSKRWQSEAKGTPPQITHPHLFTAAGKDCIRCGCKWMHRYGLACESRDAPCQASYHSDKGSWRCVHQEHATGEHDFSAPWIDPDEGAPRKPEMET